MNENSKHNLDAEAITDDDMLDEYDFSQAV